MVMLVAQGAFAGGAQALGYFTDTRGHWAEDQINHLASLGILKGDGTKPFYPDRPISRGEALATLNRVFEAVYGPLAMPERKANIDYRYPLRWEIEQLLTNMKAMYQIETRYRSDYDPGDRMLYYLFVAESGQHMRKQQKENPDWWLSSTAFQRAMTREEGSMILFHLLAPQKFRGINIAPEDAKSYFNSFYEWKQDSYYRDTFSPYASAIREFGLFADPKEFSPYQVMTRAQYAMVLSRLLDYYQRDAAAQFKASTERQKTIATVYLRAASFANEKKDESRLSAYYTSDALEKLSSFPFIPKHTEHVSLSVKQDDSMGKNLIVTGTYRDNANGTYEIKYFFSPDEESVFGRKITNVQYTEK
jgi:hypothetical protein